jgi:hypothetical protein
MFTSVSFDMLLLAAIACLTFREVALVALPDRIAGPGGWLIDTGDE